MRGYVLIVWDVTPIAFILLLARDMRRWWRGRHRIVWDVTSVAFILLLVRHTRRWWRGHRWLSVASLGRARRLWTRNSIRGWGL